MPSVASRFHSTGDLARLRLQTRLCSSKSARDFWFCKNSLTRFASIGVAWKALNELPNFFRLMFWRAVEQFQIRTLR